MRRCRAAWAEWTTNGPHQNTRAVAGIPSTEPCPIQIAIGPISNRRPWMRRNTCRPKAVLGQRAVKLAFLQTPKFTLSQTRHRSKSLPRATMVIVPKGEMPYLCQPWNGSIRCPVLW